jgi:hypothetical protein
VTIIAVNMDTKIPMERVTANPCTGPDPITKRIIATIRVVTLASTIETKARSYQALIAD